MVDCQHAAIILLMSIMDKNMLTITCNMTSGFRTKSLSTMSDLFFNEVGGRGRHLLAQCEILMKCTSFLK